MSNNSANHTRAFADVVTIDAWHSAFVEGRAKVSLHADVVFGTARLGGEPDSTIRFKLSIKRAELVVIVPETEPLRIDKASIARDAPKRTGSETKTVKEGASISTEGKVGVSLGTTTAQGEVGVQSSGKKKSETQTKTIITSRFSDMLVTQSMTAERDYRWSIECRPGEVLDGRPWDGLKHPRMKIIDTRRDPDSGVPPAVRLEMRCRREDLSISSIQLKDNNMWKRVRSRLGFGNRILAAEAYIIHRLAEEGLTTRNFSDRYGEILLATTIAEEA
jgi:hypothetical protein